MVQGESDMIIEQMKPCYDENEKKAMMEYMSTDAWYMEHKKTRELEKMLSDFTGAKYCNMIPNGTLTLIASLIVCGVKPGDEVIVPDHTIIASATAASFIGAKPVFCDVEKETACMDYESMKSKITPKTKAVMLVSINGKYPNSFDSILELCQEKNIFLVEDSAQSLGSLYRRKQIGTYGHIGSFSFSISKIITMGSGGVIITDNEEFDKEIKFMKNFGRYKGGMDENFYPGIDLKFNDLQAVVGIEQMKKLTWRIKRKKEIYNLYREYLERLKGIKLFHIDLNDTTPWMIPILVEDRQFLQDELEKCGIKTRKFYPAIHTQKPFLSDEKFPNSDYVSEHGLWLPSFINISDYEIEYVCRKIRNVIK